MKIKQNMGMIDRVFRFLVAIAIVVLYFTNSISGLAAIILMIFALVFIATSFMSFCPLYLPFNISTKSKKSE